MSQDSPWGSFATAPTPLCTAGRWERASREVGPVPDRQIDPWRPTVLARCLDQIAHAVERISADAQEINRRNRAGRKLRFPW